MNSESEQRAASIFVSYRIADTLLVADRLPLQHHRREQRLDRTEEEVGQIARLEIGAQHPDIPFARFDFDADGVQAGFLGLAGIPSADLAANIAETEAQIEAAGVDLASFVAPGEEHTIVRSRAFYEVEVGGVRLVDFLGALVAGEVSADVRPI